jgi:predicted nucleotidyltransferase
MRYWDYKEGQPVRAKGGSDGMAEVKTTVTLKDIQKIVQQIVERFHPQKVILFGSYAYGEPTEDSDLDLLIVTERRLSPEETYETRRRFLREFSIPVQLVCVNDEEFMETKDVIGGIAYPASKYGEILYEKS